MKKARTVLHKLQTFYAQHPLACTMGIFFIAWALTSFIFYLRFPNNFLYPNFFAEDGQIFTQNILDKGFISAVFTLFNGYFVCALYILTGVGFVVNAIFFGNEFINLPAALSIVSLAFFGLCCALPIVLLKKYARLGYRLAMVILLTFVPMVGFDYGTIGPIGNLKFAFAYLAVLFIMYRLTLPRTSKKIILVDALLLLCAYTTASVYLMLPFILLADGVRPKQLFNKKAWPTIFTRSNIALWSLVGLAVLALIQVVVVVVHGVPKLIGYLDAPYQPEQTIELFIGRSMLYPVVTWAYDHLNNLLVVLSFIALLLTTWKYGSKEKRPIYAFCLYAILMITGVFAVNRTGISGLFNNYNGLGPDNFFYTQNYIFIIFGTLLLADLAKKFSWMRTLYVPVLVVGIIAGGAIIESTNYAPNNFMQYQIGTIAQQVKSPCEHTTDPHEKITFSVYPFTFLTMTQPREVICTPTAYRHTGIQDFGLRPAEAGTHLPIGPGTLPLTQTFTADANNLNGVTFYLLTYYQTRLYNYTLILKDASCKQTIRVEPFPIKVRDSSYSTVNFAPIPDSKDKTYCINFTFAPNAQELAIGQSKEFVYKEGLLTINGAPQQRDLVISANYQRE